jgi:hypothetical protein
VEKSAVWWALAQLQGAIDWESGLFSVFEYLEIVVGAKAGLALPFCGLGATWQEGTNIQTRMENNMVFITL